MQHPAFCDDVSQRRRLERERSKCAVPFCRRKGDPRRRGLCTKHFVPETPAEAARAAGLDEDPFGTPLEAGGGTEWPPTPPAGVPWAFPAPGRALPVGARGYAEPTAAGPYRRGPAARRYGPLPYVFYNPYGVVRRTRPPRPAYCTLLHLVGTPRSGERTEGAAGP